MSQKSLRKSSNDAKNSSLCALVPNQISEIVVGEVEKNSFIALPGKGGHSGCVPSKLCVPTWRGGSEFCSNGSRVELLIRIRVCAGPALLSSGLR